MTLNQGRRRPQHCAPEEVALGQGRDTALDADLAVQIRQLAVDVSNALDREYLAEGHEPGAISAQRSLRSMWDAVLAETLRAATARHAPERQAELATLLSRIRDSEFAVADARIADGVEMLRRVRAALATVRDATSVDDLLTLAPEACCGLGFDRALLSEIEGSTWKLHTMCVVREPRWAEEIVAIGKENPPQLDGKIVETDIYSQAVSGLVFDAQNNPRVDRPLARVTRSSSYGIAPLTVQGKVMGFVHGDCYHQGRDVNATDRALLTLFAEGLSQALGKATVLDGLSALREGVDRIAAGIHPRFERNDQPPAATPGLLTRREADIAQLLAAGASNQQIARRLVISEGTVKSHVTHILRKLGAANRAEAVSLWLRSSASPCS